MATLAEKIAAKRLAASAPTPSPAEMVFDPVATEERAADVEEGLVAAPVAEPVPLGKPLTFMEQMALKKAAKEQASTSIPKSASAPPVKNTGTLHTIMPVKSLIPQGSVVQLADTTAAIGNGGIPANIAELQEEPDLTDVPMVDQQAYRDIKAKLDLLEDMAEVNLKDAMTDLKKALLKNPQACYLILPQDIGQMVIALRRMKNEDVVTAEKVKKAPGEKKGKASKALTAEEIATAFDEL